MKQTVMFALILALSQHVFGKDDSNVQKDAEAFLTGYQTALAKLEIQSALAAWKASNSGKKEDFDASAQASLALRQFHSDREAYERLQGLTKHVGQLPPLQARALHVALLAYRRNQLPPELLKSMVELSTEIERLFNTFRGTLDGKQLSNNDLLEMLRQEKNSPRRQAIWQSLKQVGGVVAPKLIELARLRNQAAHTLGFKNYWDMSIRLQEHDPNQLLGIFEELDRLTREPFTRMKGELDGELARRFSIEPSEIMPWHYDNPFFQAPPPSEKVDLDEFYKAKTKEQIAELAGAFFQRIGLPADTVLAKSDLYEREGKDQHAFCISIDRGGDVRTLCNIKPTAEWMGTTLHELGHAVYDLHVDRSLPFNLRESAHIFTTEGVAMLFGAVAQHPQWLTTRVGADPDRVDRVAKYVLEQRRREQLIFARWTMVMLHFEKDLYENPERQLDSLWWDYVERYQQLRRPKNRAEPDWAAKPHFTIAPVYYHNYMLGELFAAQLRHALAQLVKYDGPTVQLRLDGRKQFGTFLKEKVFAPGSSLPWPEFVRAATGEPLTAHYFAAEVQ